jgi:hypothetical protein
MADSKPGPACITWPRTDSACHLAEDMAAHVTWPRQVASERGKNPLMTLVRQNSLNKEEKGFYLIVVMLVKLSVAPMYKQTAYAVMWIAYVAIRLYFKTMISSTY